MFEMHRHDRVVIRGAFHEEEFELMSWLEASPFQRACALEPHHAAHIFEHLLSLDRHSFALHRPNILELTGMSSPLGAHRIDDMELRQLVLDRLSRTGGLILVNEGLHLHSCGAGLKPGSFDWTESSGDSQWSGDSSKWPQEKKLLSLHPKLRPLVKGVVEGMTKRGFEPKIFYGWRSVAVQQSILKKGHSHVTFSFHNIQKKDGTPDAYAADIVDRRWAWNKEAAKHGYWSALGEEAKKQGLYWGGDWTIPRPDWAHVQLVPNAQLKRFKRESGL
jgi:hypothetical protein